MTQTRNRATTRLIIDGLNGNLENGYCHCPICDHKTPKLRISDANKVDAVTTWHCFHGCTKEALKEYFTERGWWPPRERETRVRVKPDLWKQEQEREKQEDEKRKNQARVGFILRAAFGDWIYDPNFGGSFKKPLPESNRDLVKKYLNSRGIDDVPDCAMELPADVSKRFSKLSQIEGHPFKGLWHDKRPAMVVAVTHEGRPPTAHVTKLEMDGSGKAPNDPKSTWGSWSGGIIIFGEIDPKKPLLIAEGIETALSLRRITGLPVIASVNAQNMPKISADFLPQCSEIIICADEDEKGVGWNRRSKLLPTGRAVGVASVL